MRQKQDFDLVRRSFMHRCAASAFGLSLLPMLPQTVGAAADDNVLPKTGFGKAKRVIVLFMHGGLTQVDTMDPKTGESQGPGKPITNSAGGQFTTVFSKTAKVANKMTVIRSMSGDVGVHGPATYYMRTAYKEISTLRHPMLGAYAQQVLGPSHELLPSSVTVNGGSNYGNGFLPATMAPLPILDPVAGLQGIKPIDTLADLQAQLKRLDTLNRPFQERYPDRNVTAYKDFYDSAIGLMGGKDAEAFDLSKEPASMREAYGDSKLGQGCLLARRLVESGVRFVEVSYGSWDFHKTLVEGLEELGGALDLAYSQLITDLDQRGMLKDTLVVLTTEFGRTASIQNRGRNHHPAGFSIALAGGGVKGGYIYGATDKHSKVKENPVTYGDLHATIGWAMGMNHKKDILKSPSGRPIPIGNHDAQVVCDLFA